MAFLGEEAQGTFPAQARNSVPSELLESSASSSSFALQENTSCVQLLGNHHYQHLNMDKMNDVAAFITQVSNVSIFKRFQCFKFFSLIIIKIKSTKLLPYVY